MWEDCDSSRKHGVCTYTPCEAQKERGQCEMRRCCTEARQNAWTACEWHQEEKEEESFDKSTMQKSRLEREVREWKDWKKVVLFLCLTRRAKSNKPLFADCVEQELERKVEKEKWRRRRVWRESNGEEPPLKGYNSASDSGSDSTNLDTPSEDEVSPDEGVGEDGSVNLNIPGIDWADPRIWVPVGGPDH